LSIYLFQTVPQCNTCGLVNASLSAPLCNKCCDHYCTKNLPSGIYIADQFMQPLLPSCLAMCLQSQVSWSSWISGCKTQVNMVALQLRMCLGRHLFSSRGPLILAWAIPECPIKILLKPIQPLRLYDKNGRTRRMGMVKLLSSLAQHCGNCQHQSAKESLGARCSWCECHLLCTSTSCIELFFCRCLKYVIQLLIHLIGQHVMYSASY
jgi:hypothetical protein